MSRPNVHVAVDLETLSTSPAASILSIGAVAICESSGQQSQFYAATATWSQPERKIDQSTLAWWQSQSEEARRSLSEAAHADCPTLENGLERLTDWLGKLGETHEVHVWGNGASFDIAILEHAYKELSPFVPWNFRKVRDMRTLYDITLRFGMDIKGNATRVGTHHNALDDAQFQANVIIESLRQIQALADATRTREVNA